MLHLVVHVGRTHVRVAGGLVRRRDFFMALGEGSRRKCRHEARCERSGPPDSKFHPQIPPVEYVSGASGPWPDEFPVGSRRSFCGASRSQSCEFVPGADGYPVRLIGDGATVTFDFFGGIGRIGLMGATGRIVTTGWGTERRKKITPGQ